MKAPGIQSLLDWAEKQDDRELTEDVITQAQWYGRFQLPARLCPIRLSEAIWGFLNHCLSGDARDTFEAATSLNGIDAWRRLVNDIYKTRYIRRETLREQVKTFPPMRKLEDIEAAIRTYDNNVREYESANGGEKVWYIRPAY